ncbi:MAG: hypothetical protein PHN45_00100 [Methylococcales bacterium]|nr:hypothetical protein [Methylococcales bacterium]
MGFVGWLGGIVGAKTAIVVFSASMYVSTGLLAAGSLVCPVLAPVAAGTLALAESSTLMVVSPIDPISLAVASVTAVATGPV